MVGRMVFYSSFCCPQSRVELVGGGGGAKTTSGSDQTRSSTAASSWHNGRIVVFAHVLSLNIRTPEWFLGEKEEWDESAVPWQQLTAPGGEGGGSVMTAVSFC